MAKTWSVLILKYINMSLLDAVMPYIFVDEVCKRFFVISTPSDGVAPFDQLRAADIPDASKTAPNMVSTVTAARPHDVDFGFRHWTNWVFCTLDETMRSNISILEMMWPWKGGKSSGSSSNAAIFCRMCFVLYLMRSPYGGILHVHPRKKKS